MPLPPPPDLARPAPRLIASALAVTVIVGVMTGVRDAAAVTRTLGDTDDAMRMVLVRGLLSGQGWWSQHLLRLQPPVGLYMHWSRLLDGGIAALDWTLARFLPQGEAEWVTRFVWPLLWIFPAALSALIISDRTADRPEVGRAPGAALIAAILLVANLILYIQFHPGRVDHHDVQMTLFLVGLAGGAQRRARTAGAVAAGVAAGLGLAVGLEALLFDMVIGAAFALPFIRSTAPDQPRALKAYGLALAGTALLAFCIQTPPDRWTFAACDALAFNSLLAIVVAGVGVAAASVAPWRRPAARLLALALVGVAAGGTYLALDPVCLKGPFADVDPAIRVFWLAHVQEMRPWLVVVKQAPADAIGLAAGPVLATVGLIWLARRREARRDPLLRLLAALLIMTSATGFSGVRMCGYADWTAVPLIAAAAADLAWTLARRYGWDPLTAILLAAVLFTPELSAHAADLGVNAASALMRKGPPKRAAARGPGDHCFDTASYRGLAALTPPGLVLSEIDLGPFILAHTQDSVLAAPYHRMNWGLKAARRALAADAGAPAEAQARALGVRYVVECRAHQAHSDRVGMSAASLQKRLDSGAPPPAWLEPMSPSKDALQVFRVAPGVKR